MALDFPTSPANGQTFGNYTYDSAAGGWRSSALYSLGVAVGGSPGQFLTKTGADNYETGWGSVPTSPNYIINGAFDIWQRGTTFNAIAANTYFADRWAIAFKDAGITLNVSQQTFTPGSAPVSGYEGQFYARLANTAFSTDNTYYVGQKIENVRTFAGQVVTLSYWARVSSGTLTPARLYLNQQFGSGGSAEVDNIGSATPTYTTSWQRFTQTITVPSISGKTVGANSFLWLLWQITPNANVTLDIWGVQVEQGSVATSFRRNAPSIQAELAACQRYYHRATGPTVYSILCQGLAYTSTTATMLYQLPVSMRVVPSAIEWANIQISDVASAGTPSSIVLATSSISERAAALTVTATGLTAFRPYVLSNNGNAAGYLGFSAEL